MTSDKIKEEFKYLHEVLASERETYVWAINYVQDNIFGILKDNGFDFDKSERNILKKRMSYLEKRIAEKEEGQEINLWMIELSALRKIGQREKLVEEL